MGTGSGKLCGQAGIFESFARELLGVRYGRVPGEAAVCVLLYSVFAVMEYRIQIAPGILCFMVWLCAGGVMWRCISSHKKDGHLKSILMMPFDRKELLFSCVGAYSLYTVLTAVAPLLAVAAVLPVFFRGLDRSFSLPIGFAILSLNTPAGILLSCDPSTEQAVRLLPGQAARFFLPYGIFVFLCNMAADLIYLGSGWLQMGSAPAAFLSGVPPVSLSRMASGMGTAAVFSLLAAAGTVLLERFFPIRRWKTENDLWRHPRKYIVPAVLLLAAGFFGGVLW